MTAMSVPKRRPRRWASQVKGRKDWRMFFNTLFWNLNYWDSASTMAGEVDRPERTFPRALAVAVVLIAVSYLLPLMAATGATDAPPDAWVNGYLADAAGIYVQTLTLLLSASQDHYSTPRTLYCIVVSIRSRNVCLVYICQHLRFCRSYSLVLQVNISFLVVEVILLEIYFSLRVHMLSLPKNIYISKC
jgi:hypothetical protein